MTEEAIDLTDGRAFSEVIPDASESELLPPRIRLEATLGMERAIVPLLVAGLVVFFIGLELGPGRKSMGVISRETSWLISLWGGGGLAACAGVLRILVDDYYVLDRQARRIFRHKGLRFFGTEFPFLESHQVAAIGLNCAPRKGKYGQTGWTYTPVLLTRTLKEIELASLSTNMECKQLTEYNRRTRQWASALQCFWIRCPSDTAFDVSDYFDVVMKRANLK